MGTKAKNDREAIIQSGFGGSTESGECSDSSFYCDIFDSHGGSDAQEEEDCLRIGSGANKSRVAGLLGKFFFFNFCYLLV